MLEDGPEPATRRSAGLAAAALAFSAPVGLAELAPLEAPALALGLLAGLAAWAFLSRYGPRFGPRHLLDALFPLIALVLLALALFDPLGLPARVRLVTHPLLGLAAAATLWSLAYLPGPDRATWTVGPATGLALGGLAALTIGTSLVLLAPAFGLLVAWAWIREVPDPIRPDHDPLDAYVPWADLPARRPWPGWTRLPLTAPATLGYLALGWALFLAWGEQTPDGFGLDTARFEPWLYEIPDLSVAPLEAARSLATAPLLNHDLVQLVYVTGLLVLFGVAVEAREGTRRASVVFLAAGVVAALVAGVLLHVLVDLFPDSGLLEHAWERTWSGGSAGAFGLMGALAARARKPVPLLAFFVFWEANVGFFYLESYTPAFHLTALAVGFWIARRWDPTAREATS